MMIDTAKRSAEAEVRSGGTAAGDAANPPSLDGSLAYVFARHHIVDLDEPQDWEYAEALYRLRFGTGE